MRIIAITFVLGILFSAIGFIFWYQQLQYLLPTPVPKNYKAILAGQFIIDTALQDQSQSTTKLLHFFNPDCPCSRFNLKHFLSLKNKYNKQIDFYAVVTSEEKLVAAKELLDEDIPILIDQEEKLAKACGVYSTPQAAILSTSNQLYFRGNYNRSRYCTDPHSNYVQMALDSLAAGKRPPHFGTLATLSYGCSIAQ